MEEKDLKMLKNFIFIKELRAKLKFTSRNTKHTLLYDNLTSKILQIIEVLEHSGYENLITFAHGDAKPNNFMFRSIEIDLEELVRDFCFSNDSQQVLANRGPNLRFVVKAIIKVMISKSSRCLIMITLNKPIIDVVI